MTVGKEDNSRIIQMSIITRKIVLQHLKKNSIFCCIFFAPLNPKLNQLSSVLFRFVRKEPQKQKAREIQLGLKSLLCVDKLAGLTWTWREREREGNWEEERVWLLEREREREIESERDSKSGHVGQIQHRNFPLLDLAFYVYLRIWSLPLPQRIQMDLPTTSYRSEPSVRNQTIIFALKSL